MNTSRSVTATIVAATLLAASAAFADGPAVRHDMGATHQGMGAMHQGMGAAHQDMGAFMKACDTDHDGMMSRAEMHAHMDKSFDRQDTGKTGKLDSRQAEDFLREFTKLGGG